MNENILRSKNWRKNEAYAEACVAIVTREGHDEEIERDKHRQSIKTLKIEYDQALKTNNPRRILYMLNLDEHKLK